MARYSGRWRLEETDYPFRWREAVEKVRSFDVNEIRIRKREALECVERGVADKCEAKWPRIWTKVALEGRRMEMLPKCEFH